MAYNSNDLSIFLKTILNQPTDAEIDSFVKKVQSRIGKIPIGGKGGIGGSSSGIKILDEKEIERYQQHMQNMLSNLKNSNIKIFNSSDVQKEVNSFKNALNGLTSGTSTKSDIKDLNLQFETLKTHLHSVDSASQKTGQSLFDAASKFSQWYLLAGAITSVIDKLKDGISFINELNKSMTNIQMITGQSSMSVIKMTQDFSVLASTLHETTSNVMEASEEFLRAGNNSQETSKLLQASTVMSKIAGQSQEETAQGLISIMNAFHLNANDMMSVVDKMVAIDNTSATSTAELNAAIQKTAASAQEAGVNIDQLISWIGTVSSVSRQSASTIGAGFNSIFARFQSIREGKNFDPDNQPLNNVEKALNRVGIAMRSDAVTFKSFNTILSEVSNSWSKYNDVQKNEIATAIAGTYQRNKFLVLMQNMNTATEMQKTELTSAGNAMLRYNTYAESTEAKLNDLTNAFQQMWMKSISSDTINSFIGNLTKIIETMSDLGGIIPILSGLLAGILTNAIMSAVGAIKLLIAEGVTLNALMGGLPIVIGLVVTGLTALGFGLLNNVSAYQKLYEKQKQLEDSYNSQIKKSDEMISKQNGEAQVAETLAKKLELLNDKEHLNVAEKAQMKNIVEQLNQVLPNLNLQIDNQTGKIVGNTQAIYDNIEALKSQAIAQGYQSKASAAGEAYANQEELLGETKNKLDQAKKDLADAQNKYVENQKNQLDSNDLFAGLKNSKNKVDYSSKLSEVQKLQDLIDQQTKDLENYGNKIDEYTTNALKYAPKTSGQKAQMPEVDLSPSGDGYIPSGGGSTSTKTPIGYQDQSSQYIDAYNASVKLNEQELKHVDTLISLADKQKDYNKEINLTNQKISLQKKTITDLEKANDKISQAAQKIRNSTGYNTESWFDKNGNATQSYLNLVKSFEGKTDNESKQELSNIEKMFGDLQKLKQAWSENRDKVDSYKIAILDSQASIDGLKDKLAEAAKAQQELNKKANDDKLKLYNDSVNQIKDLLKKQYQAESDSWDKSLDKFKRHVDDILEEQDRLYDTEDYNSKVQESTDKINELNAKINEYSSALLSGDLEAINQVAQLQKDKSEEEKNLKKTQTDRERTLVKQQYQDNVKAYEDLVKEKKDALEKSTEDTALQLQTEQILAQNNIEAVQNSINTLFDITSENATSTGKLLQKEIIDRLAQLMDIQKNLSSITGGSSGDNPLGMNQSDFATYLANKKAYSEGYATAAQLKQNSDLRAKYGITKDQYNYDQLKGYKNGTDDIVSMVGENGRELKILNPNGRDSIVPNSITEKIVSFAQNPLGFINNISSRMPQLMPVSTGVGGINVSFGSLLSVENLSNIDENKLTQMTIKASDLAITKIQRELFRGGQRG